MARRRRRRRRLRVLQVGWRWRRPLLIANVVLVVWGIVAAVVALRVWRKRKHAPPGTYPGPATPEQEQSGASMEEVAGSKPAAKEGV